MTLMPRIVIAIAIAISLAGCFGPKDRRPGMRLPGEVTPTPSDWSFTSDHPEIAIEVRTPYFLPHSVTIVCGTLDGNLYVGASNPETKRWPGWVDRDPDVRLKIGEKVYEVRLAPLDDEAQLALLRTAYASKYELPDPAPAGSPPSRYWSVEPRS